MDFNQPQRPVNGGLAGSTQSIMPRRMKQPPRPNHAMAFSFGEKGVFQ